MTKRHINRKELLYEISYFLIFSAIDDFDFVNPISCNKQKLYFLKHLYKEEVMTNVFS